MSAAESTKFNVISRVIDGLLTVKDAADMLGLSERQIKRLKKDVKEKGPAALVHGNRGRKPAHALSANTKSFIVNETIEKFRGTSCEHISEMLEENCGVIVCGKTVSRILHGAGVELHFAKKQPRRRKTRDRMPQEGMLVQIDASQHDWLEQGYRVALHGAIDDATGKILALWFRPTEDLEGYFVLLEQMIQNYGTPMSIYSDRHTIFFSSKRDKLTLEEELAGELSPVSQFGRALRELGIVHIPATSAQAKGRVERLWGTLQSRLLVELRCAQVTNLEEANAYLPTFVERFNRKFSVEPRENETAYGPKHDPKTLTMTCCSKIQRSASHGSYISFMGETLQLITTRGKVEPLRPKSKVTLLLRNKTIRALYNGQIFVLKKIAKPEKQTAKPSIKANPKQLSPVDTPWRQWSICGPARPRKSVVDKFLDRNEPTWNDYANSTEIRHRLGDS